MSVRPANQNYRCLVYGPTGIVDGWLPEQFSLRLQSDWEPLLANLIEQAMGGTAYGGILMAGNDALAVGGISPFVQSLTGQVWRRTEPIEFQIDLQFDAESDPKRDVDNKVQKLIEYATPKGYNGYLKAPGPTIPQHQEMFSVRIGRQLWIRDVIFPALDVTWYTAPHSSGVFIAADVSLTVRTFFTPTQQDILSWFSGGAGGPTNRQGPL